MCAYLFSRLAAAILVVFGVSLIVFFLTFLSGDPAILMLPADATAEQIQRFRHAMGYDNPILVQYGHFIGRAIRGDFGRSIRHSQPALPLILQHLPATFELSLFAMALAVGLAFPLGVLSAIHRGTWLDLGCMFVALVGQSVPNFWLAIMLISWFAVTLRLLPTSGRGGIAHILMPGLAIAINLMALLTRLMRSTMLEVLNEDYVRTARVKGLREMIVIGRHALQNALIPLVTVMGVQFGYILGGAVVIETVFMWPGVGLFTVQAIMNRDYPVVQASVFILATAVVFISLAVDLIYGLLDPRMRVEA